MTALLGITSAVLAALTTPALRADKGSVVRGRRTPIPASDKWGVKVNATGHRGAQLDLRATSMQWETQVDIGVDVRATSGEDAEAALDPLLAEVWARLVAMTPPFGAESVALDPVIAIDIEEAEQTLASARLSLRVTHYTDTALAAMA